MKLVLFDVDGTLIDSQAMIAASLNAAFGAEALTPPPRPAMMAVVGLSLLDAMASLAPDREAAVHQRMAAAYKEAFWTFRASGEFPERFFPGARELLEGLRRRSGVLLGIATGKSRRGIAHLVEAHGLEGWFATVQTSDDHPSKPDPSMVHAALAETGCDPAATMVVGDTGFDVAMARNAAVTAIGVTWGNHPKDRLAQAGAHRIVNDFDELQAAIDSFWQET